MNYKMNNLELQVFALITVRNLSLLQAVKMTANFRKMESLTVISFLSDSFIKDFIN